MKTKGMTLIELIAVLVILGIISTIALFIIGGTIQETKIQVDSYNLSTINLVTNRYAAEHPSSQSDIFNGINSDEDRMSALVQAGYLFDIILPQQSGASFTWNISEQTWELQGGETIEVISNNSVFYDFADITLEEFLDEGAIPKNDNHWEISDDALTSNDYTTLFIPTNKIEYTITVSAQISEGTGGGYGIFFETTLDNDNPDRDSGYVLQFDRGYAEGTILVRERSNGSEMNPIWQIRANQTDLFPNKTDDPDWWIDSHTFIIEVSIINDTTKQAVFYLDGEELGTIVINSAESGETIYTGFRVWWTTASFYEIEID